MAWDGKTERRGSPSDHDHITRLLVSVENHVKNFEQHVKDDEKNFGSTNKKVDQHAIYIYMGLGAIGLIELWSKLK